MSKLKTSLKGLDSTLTPNQIAKDLVKLYPEVMKKVSEYLSNLQKEFKNESRFPSSYKIKFFSISGAYGLPYSLYYYSINDGITFGTKTLNEHQATNANYIEELLIENWPLITSFWNLYKTYGFLDELGVIQIDYTTEGNEIHIFPDGYNSIFYASSQKLEEEIQEEIKRIEKEHKKRFKLDSYKSRLWAVRELTKEDHLEACLDLGKEGVKICDELSHWVDYIGGYAAWEACPYYFSVTRIPETNKFQVKWNGNPEGADYFNEFKDGLTFADCKEFQKYINTLSDRFEKEELIGNEV